MFHRNVVYPFSLTKYNKKKDTLIPDLNCICGKPMLIYLPPGSCIFCSVHGMIEVPQTVIW